MSRIAAIPRQNTKMITMIHWYILIFFLFLKSFFSTEDRYRNRLLYFLPYTGFSEAPKPSLPDTAPGRILRSPYFWILLPGKKPETAGESFLLGSTPRYFPPQAGNTSVLPVLSGQKSGSLLPGGRIFHGIFQDILQRAF